MTFLVNIDLRKQARQLENEIDAKLVSFSKLGSGSISQVPKANGWVSLQSNLKNVTLHIILDTNWNYRENIHLLNEDFVFESMTGEIQQLLHKASVHLSWTPRVILITFLLFSFLKLTNKCLIYLPHKHQALHSNTHYRGIMTYCTTTTQNSKRQDHISSPKRRGRTC